MDTLTPHGGHRGANSDKLSEMIGLDWSVPPDPSETTTDLSAFLDLASPLEITSRAQTPQAVALVERLAQTVMDFEDLDRERPRGPIERQKVLDATGTIIGGVLRAWGRDRARPVALARSNKALGNVPGGRKAVQAVVDVLVKVRFLAFKPAVRWKVDYGFKVIYAAKMSRVWPTTALLKLATDGGLEPKTIRAAFLAPQPTEAPKVDETVRVKGVKVRGQKEAPTLPLETLADAPRLVAEVADWNAFAATVSVEGCRAPRWFRVFGPDVALGGRWYAAGWPHYQNMNGDERLGIRIGGQPVIEADVKAAHLSIMHGLLGLPVSGGDPYEIGTESRAAVKAWIVATLGKGSPVVRWAADVSPAVKAHDAKRLGEAICRRYPFLRDPSKAVAEAAGLNRLATRWGTPKRLLPHRLMGIEASAITRAMRDLRARLGVLSLPVHDSLIVPVRAAELVRGVLVEAFRTEAGATVEVAIDWPGRHPADF